MTENLAQHLSYGALVVLAQSDSAMKKNPKAYQHLKSCRACSDRYKYVISFKRNTNKPEFMKLTQTLKNCKCSETEVNFEKNVSLFLATLTKEVPEESASRLFSHLNSCYPCLEYFAVNWSDYLSIKS